MRFSRASNGFVHGYEQHRDKRHDHQYSCHVAQYNQHNRPFVWTATADSIIQKMARLCKVISGTEH